MVIQERHPQIVLKDRRERSLLRRHPWVFSGAIESAPEGLKIGDVVDLCDSSGKFIARGLWSDGSIAVKALTFKDEPIDREFWMRTIERAINLRKALGLFETAATDAFRLVHGEGDFLPGLVIDLFGKTAVVQLQNATLQSYRTDIVSALAELLKDRLSGIVDKSLTAAQGNSRSEETVEGGQVLWGVPAEPIISENSLKFKVDWKSGQKTGFFLDQRENRMLLKKYVRDKSILNAFCYSGAFSIYALDGGASSVVSLDASKRAVELLEENLILNNYGGEHKSVASDYFSFIKEQESKYDLVILDPPAFAKHRSAIDEGVKGYTNINYYALKSLNSCGMLMTFSCSQLVTWEMFWRAVQEAALRAGRSVRILHRLYQAPCHPVSISHPEGDYLKGLLLYVQ